MAFKILQQTPLFDIFSEVGRRVFLPEGIFYWSGRAKKEAQYDATLGVAYAYEKDFIQGGDAEWVPCYLEYINDYFKNLKINELVPYASIPGIQDLRTLWKEWIVFKSLIAKQHELDFLRRFITTPVITNGVTNAIYLSSLLFLDPGEHLITPNKRWGNYDNIMRLIGAKISSFEFFDNDQMNFNALKETIHKVSVQQKKIVLMLNFPNNPTGYVPSKDTVEELKTLLLEEQSKLKIPFVILVDDAYEPYVFENNVIHRSIFYDLQALNENVIPVKLDGITKELLLYGGRIGFITIGLKPSWLMKGDDLEILKSEIDNKLSGLVRSTISNCNHFYQAISIKMLQEKGFENLIKARSNVINLLKQRFECVNSELKKLKNPLFTIDPNSGGFFTFLNLDSRKLKASEFADHLLREYKVGVIPIEKPEENINGIRLAYCSLDIQSIPEVVKKIDNALKNFHTNSL